MENNENVLTDSVGMDNVGTQAGQTTQSSEHVFTQEQLNSIISSRINPLNQKVQELSNQLAKSEKLTQQYHAELQGYKNKEVALKQGIPSELLDYAIFEASKMVTKEKSFEDALKEFKESKKALFVGTQTSSGSENASTQSENNGQQDDKKEDTNAQISNNQTVNMTTGQNLNSGSASVDDEVKKYLENRRKRR